MTRSSATVEAITQPAGIPGVDLIPGSNSLARFNYPGAREDGPAPALAPGSAGGRPGRRTTRSCATRPPSLETLSWLPAMAADVALTPTPAEALAVQELVHAGRFLERVRWAGNPRLVWLGVALTMYQPRLAIHEAFAQVAARDLRQPRPGERRPLQRGVQGVRRGASAAGVLEAQDGRRPRRSTR